MSVFGFFTGPTIRESASSAMVETYGGQDNVSSQMLNRQRVFLAARNKLKRCHVFASGGEMTAIFHGHITNRRRVASFTATSTDMTDAALFLRAFEKSADRITDHVEGSYCAAVWDARRGRLHLITDPLGGAYTFYFTRVDNSLYFATRLPALLAIDSIAPKLNLTALYSLFSTGYVLPPQSLLSGVQKTWPAQQVVFDGQDVRRQFTSQPLLLSGASTTDATSTSLESTLNEVLSELTSQNHRCGWLLSGGIDSGVLVSMASRLSSQPLDTFSATFPGTVYDEREYAEIIAKDSNCNSRFIDMSASNTLDSLPKVVWELDEPFLDFSAIPTYALLKKVGQYVRAVVSGDGPDHLLGRYYPLAAKCLLRKWTPLIEVAASMTRTPVLRKLATIGQGNLLTAHRTLFSYPTWGGDPETCNELFTSAVPTSDTQLDSELAIDISNTGDLDTLMAKLIRLDSIIDGAFGVFQKVGKMARANDVVIHWPYLDGRIIRTAHALPREAIVPGRYLDLIRSRCRPKHALANGIAPKYLSRKILEKNKGGFTPPLLEWLRRLAAARSADSFLSPGLRNRNLFNLMFVNQILREHTTGVRDWTTVLFLLLSFDIWFNMFILGRTITPPLMTLDDFLRHE